MLKLISKTLSAVALAALASGALAEKGEPWLTDMEEAQKVAKAEGKDIFMFFTGSDWCVWCIRLENEVLSKKEFLDYAEENLVLVDLDFPQGEGIISEEQWEHNDKWAEKFKPKGYPTVILTDADANGFAQTGYREGGAEKYIAHLKTLKTNKDQFAALEKEAASASGLERAKLLVQMVDMEGAMIEDPMALIKEIADLSKGQDKELYNKYSNILANQELGGKMNKLFSGNASKEEKLTGALELFDTYKHLKDGQALQQLVAMIGDQHIGNGKTAEGVAFMETLMNDESFALPIRQDSALFRGIIMANGENPDLEKVKVYYQEAIDMAPQSQTGQRAAGMLQELQNK